MRKLWKWMALAVCGLTLTAALPAMAQEQTPIYYMSVKQLGELLDSPDLILLDVRTEADWQKSGHKAKGARHVDPFAWKFWAQDLDQTKIVVLYCECKKDETSSWVAQRLDRLGFVRTYVLHGGWEEYEKSGLPLEPK